MVTTALTATTTLPAMFTMWAARTGLAIAQANTKAALLTAARIRKPSSLTTAA